MPIAVDYTTTIDDVTIKCSKPFNELGSITVNDLLPYAISGIHDIGVGRAGLSCETFSNYTDIENNTPVEYINSSQSDVRVKYHTEYNPFRANPHYGFTILAYGTDWQTINSTTENTRLVLDIPIQDIYVEMPTYSKNTINKVNDGDASTVDSIDWYNTGDTGTVRTVSNNAAIPDLQILTVFVLDDSNFIIMNATGQKGAPFVHTTYAWHGNTGNAAGGTSGTTAFLPYYSTTYLSNTARYVNMANDDALEGNAFGNVDWSRNFVVLFDTPDNEHEQTNSYVVVTYTGAGPPDFNGTVTFYPKGGERAAMLGFANSCLKFKYGNTMYKPLISGGAVYDYTDDMTAESEFDDITNVTGNNVPLTPPSPPVPEEDESDDQAWGGAYSGAGAFSKFYLCTATDLANLRTWFGGGGTGDQIPDGFDPMGQVLGLLQYPLSISGTALAAEEIVFRSGKTIVHTGVNATRSTGGFLHIDCGSVEIPRRMQQRGVPFLDFETTLEIYVPFCGTAPLDVQACVGKTLTCDMYVATATGDVSAVIAAGGHPVAYMSGNMAESLPISSAGYGMYLAACKSTWGNGVSQVMNQLTGGTTSTIKNVNQAALNETLSYNQTGGWGQSELLTESYNNPVIGKGMAGAASAKGVAAIGLTTTALNVANAASTGYEQYQRVKHASYTSVSGSFTSCAAWNYPFTPYVKITRPLKQIPTGGRGDYKHTAAIPLVETRTLSGAPGLTTCVNPDVSGIANATAQEKDIIYRALVNGVIV